MSRDSPSDAQQALAADALIALFHEASLLRRSDAIYAGLVNSERCAARVLFLESRAYHSRMHVITRKRLNTFAEKYPETKTALAHWYGLAKHNDFSNFAGLREVFSSADQVGKLTVFNIGGNKIRLVAAIHYNRKKIYIRAVLTHAEYDAGKWKE